MDLGKVLEILEMIVKIREEVVNIWILAWAENKGKRQNIAGQTKHTHHHHKDTEKLSVPSISKEVLA